MRQPSFRNKKFTTIDKSFATLLLLVIYLILVFTFTEVLIIRTFFSVSQFHQQLLTSSWDQKNNISTEERGEIFYISSKDNHYPQFFQKLRINPFYDAKAGEKQYFSIWARDPEGIERVVVIVDPDKNRITIPLRLAKGDKFSGKWTGDWIVKDFSRDEAIDLLFEAENTKGEITHLKTYFHFLKSEHSESFLFKFKELFIPIEVEAATQCPLPATGNITISSDCYIPQGEETGVEDGNLIIKATITMERNSSLIFNPGKKIVISEGGYILKSANNTSVKKGHIVCTDECSNGDIEYRCLNNWVQRKICGNYDADSCLEWSSWQDYEDCASKPTDCGYGVCDPNERPQWYCVNGACEYQCVDSADCCTDECNPGEKMCDSVHNLYECQRGASGCYEWQFVKNCFKAEELCDGRLYYVKEWGCWNGKCTVYQIWPKVCVAGKCGAQCNEGSERSTITCDGDHKIRVTEVCNDNCFWETSSQVDLGCDYACGAECESSWDCPSGGFECRGDKLYFVDYWCSSISCRCREDLSDLGCDFSCGASCESDDDCAPWEWCDNCQCRE